MQCDISVLGAGISIKFHINMRHVSGHGRKIFQYYGSNVKVTRSRSEDHGNLVDSIVRNPLNGFESKLTEMLINSAELRFIRPWGQRSRLQCTSE